MLVLVFKKIQSVAQSAGEVSVGAPLLSRIALQLGDDIRTWHG